MKIFSMMIFLSSLFSSAVFPQASSKKPLKECNALLARQIVEQQAEEGKSVTETDQRIKILLRVADFLWTADEPTARKYFAEAFQIAQERFRAKDVGNKKSEGLMFFQSDYRFDVIAVVAKRDAEWAKKLSEIVLKEFDEDKEKGERTEIGKDSEVRSILGIAGQAAKDNPNLSLTLARRAMRYPLNTGWYFTLFQMAGKNQPLADKIYAELLANYADAEVYRLLYLSAYPFGSGRIFGVEKYRMGTSVPAQFSPNRDLQQRFLLTLFRRVMRLTPENTSKSVQDIPETAIAAMALNDLETLVPPQFPDLTQAFSQAKAHAAAIVETDSLEAAKRGDEANKNFSKPFEEKLDELEKDEAAGKLNDNKIFQLVNVAETDEHFKKAESWLDKVKDETTRIGLTNFFYFQRSKLATKENRFEDARRYALKVPKLEHRAVLFFDIAEAKMKEPLTKSESLDTLLEVWQTANKSPDSVEKAQVLLGLAFMYEKVDHFNALSALDDAVKTANKLENPNLFTGSVTQMVKGKTFTHYSGYTVPGFVVTETFYELGKKDFPTALTYATNFSDRYVRTLAVLATVKDCEKNVGKDAGKTKNNPKN